MAVKDGEIIIDTQINTDGAQVGVKDITKSLEKIVAQLRNLQITAQTICDKMGKSFTTASNGVEQTAESATAAQKAIKKTGDEAAKTAKKLNEASKVEFNVTDDSGTRRLNADGTTTWISRNEDLNDTEEWESAEKESVSEVKNAFEDYYEWKAAKERADAKNADLKDKQAQLLNEVTSEVEQEEKQLTLLQQIRAAKANIKALEADGLGAGDESYDFAQKDLIALTEKMRAYTKQMVYETQAETSALFSLEQRIANVNALIEEKKGNGVGIEDPEMQSLLSRLAELKGKYKEVYTEASKTPAQKAEAERLKAIGDSAQVSNAKIVQLNNELTTLTAKMNDFKAAGITSGYAEYDSTAARIREIKAELKSYGSASDNAKKKTSVFDSAMKNLKKTMSGVKGAIAKIPAMLKSMSKTFGNIGSKILGIGKNVKSMNVSLNGGLKTVLKYTLGIRSMYVLFNKLRTALVSGFQNLAQYSSTTNASISSLMSALTRLKNSLATAFAPILNVIAPILTSFINMLSTAITYVGMFIAALTGQSSYTKAIGVNQDYAASLGDTADAAQDAADSTGEAEKAAKSYLTSLDNINKVEADSSSGSGGSGGSGSGGGTGTGAMFETVPIESSIKGIADKIRQLIKDEDFEGLGEYIASGINKGLQKIYDVINWENASKKIVPFISAFTTTLNSLVDNIDWDLMGRTVGAGINTLAKSFNLLTKKINFENIGKSLSKALKGMLKEVDWRGVGNAIGNYFMISWRIFNGFVKDMASVDNITGMTGFQTLGTSIAEALNGIFDKVNFETIADTLVTGINGAFDALAQFTETFEWKEFAANVKSGITKVISDMHWKENGEALGKFLSNLCDAISDMIDDGTFYRLGQKIGEFLSQLPWGTLLKTAAKVLVEGFGGLIAGMFTSGDFGTKVIAGISAALLVTKVSNILGISSLAGKIVSALGSELVSKAGTLAGKIAEMIGGASDSSKAVKTLGDVAEAAGDVAEAIGDAGTAAETASKGGFKSLISKLGTLTGGGSGSFTLFGDSLLSMFGTAGVFSGAIVGTVALAKGIGSIYDKISGGNGKLTETGTALETYAGNLQQAGQLTSTELSEIWQLIEADESAGVSRTQMIKNVNDKLSEMGVSASGAKSALDKMSGTTAVQTLDELYESVKDLGTGFSTAATTIDTSKVTVSDAISGINTVMSNLATTSGEANGAWQGALMAFQNTQGSCTTAEDALTMLKGYVEDAGLKFDDFLAAWGVKFPNTMQTASTTASQKSKEIHDSISGEISSTSETAKTKMEIVKGAVSDNLLAASSDSSAYAQQIKDNISNSVKQAEADASSSMKQIESDTSTNLYNANQDANTYMGGISKVTSDKFSETKRSAYETTTGMKTTLSTGLKEVNSTVETWMKTIRDTFSRYFGYIKTDTKTAINTDLKSALTSSFPSLVSTCRDYGKQMGQAVADGISAKSSTIKSTLNSCISKTNGAISNINSAISSIERAFTFSYSYSNPINNTSGTISSSLSLGRVGSVPYLATGAVIPPNAPFTAVLGDQKHGTNIETPENLLRKIVREETGGSNGGGQYKFTAQINRRTLFEEMITEAKLARSQSGKNPFALA